MRLLCLLLAVLNAFAQTKTPITHEKVWTMKRVGVPVASPDGRWAVVSVIEPAYDAAQQSSDLWLVATDASRPAPSPSMRSASTNTTRPVAVAAGICFTRRPWPPA